jgi:hypothetical protein
MALNFGTSAALTMTSMNNLGSSTTSYAASQARDTSTTNNITDIMVSVKITVGAIVPSSSTNVYVYAYGVEDSVGSPTYPGGGATAEVITGADAAVTMSATSNNLKFLGSINCHTASIQFKSEPMSLVSCLGVLPRKWGILLQNQTGVALAATGNSASATEIYYN